MMMTSTMQANRRANSGASASVLLLQETVRTMHNTSLFEQKAIILTTKHEKLRGNGSEVQSPVTKEVDVGLCEITELTEPEFSSKIAESSGIFGPVSVKVNTAIFTSLQHLQSEMIASFTSDRNQMYKFTK